MISRKVIFLLPLIIELVSGYCNLYSELERVQEQIGVCEQEVSPYAAIRMLQEMSENVLTHEQYVSKLYQFCEKPSNTLKCLTENINVREDCQENGEIQSAMNMQITSWYSAKYLCENNGTRYLDFAESDGPTCYANNDAHRHCIFQSKNERFILDRAAVSNRNICRMLDIAIECLSTYDACQNKKVREYIENLNGQLQQRFGCLQY